MPQATLCRTCGIREWNHTCSGARVKGVLLTRSSAVERSADNREVAGAAPAGSTKSPKRKLRGAKRVERSDGVTLVSMPMPDGLLEQTVGAIRSGKLSLDKPAKRKVAKSGKPKRDRKEYMRELMRKRREAGDAKV